jgi:hypothetical protein
MNGLARAFGLKKALWWRTQPEGVYTERWGVGRWQTNGMETRVWIKGKDLNNECHLKVLINDRKVIARVERRSTIWRLMRLIGENGDIEEMEVHDKAARRASESSGPADWPDRGVVTIKTREWLMQKKEEWNKREKERMQRLQEAREIDRCLFYGRVFRMDESAWQGEADTMEGLEEVIAGNAKPASESTVGSNAKPASERGPDRKGVGRGENKNKPETARQSVGVGDRQRPSARTSEGSQTGNEGRSRKRRGGVPED